MSTTQIADAITTASSITSTTSTSSSGSNLSVDTDTFLKLLVAQLSNQDPLNPQEDTEFITQLAQMTTLEEMQQISSGMESMQAYSLVGKYAYAEVTDSETGDTNYLYGTIDSVVNENGTYYAIIGDATVEVDNIEQVFDSSLLEDTTLIESSNLIGKTVTGLYEAEDGTTASVTGVVSGVTYDGETIYVTVDDMQIALYNISDIAETVTDTTVSEDSGDTTEDTAESE